MKYSNMLGLDEFFYALRDEEYAIIKISEDFPNYYKRSDIDIFCTNVEEFAKVVLEVGNRYLSKTTHVEVVTDEDNPHTYIDFYFDGDLDFRFDLYSKMPCFNAITTKDYFLYSVIDRRIKVEREYNDLKYPIFVPSDLDEIILRYLEYMEWYEKRPDKIKHLDYILERIGDEKTRKRFLDRLHLYAELPPLENKNEHIRSYIISRYFSLPLYYLKKIKSKGVVGSFVAIKRRVLKKP